MIIPISGIWLRKLVTTPPITPITIITMYHTRYFPHPIMAICSSISPNLKAAPSSLSYKAMLAMAIIAISPNTMARTTPIRDIPPKSAINIVGSAIPVIDTEAIEVHPPIIITTIGIMK